MVDQSLIEQPKTTNTTLEVFPKKDLINRSVRNHTLRLPTCLRCRIPWTVCISCRWTTSECGRRPWMVRFCWHDPKRRNIADGDRPISKWSATPRTRFYCLILLYYTQGSARAVIVFIDMANSSHLGFCVKMVSKLFTNVYSGNQMSAFEENDTPFVFLAHWVPAMMNLNIFQNGAWRPSWICALQGHSRIQLKGLVE